MRTGCANFATVFLCAYAVPGTDNEYGGIWLRARYAMSGTEIGYGYAMSGTEMGYGYAMSGTEIGYGGTR
eukprot:3571836-Rhodomonas_salina.1